MCNNAEKILLFKNISKMEKTVFIKKLSEIAVLKPSKMSYIVNIFEKLYFKGY